MNTLTVLKLALMVYICITALFGTVRIITLLASYFRNFTSLEIFFEQITAPFLYIAYLISALPLGVYFYSIILVAIFYIFTIWTVHSYKEIKDGYTILKKKNKKTYPFICKYLSKWFLKLYIYSMSFLVTFSASIMIYAIIIYTTFT